MSTGRPQPQTPALVTALTKLRAARLAEAEALGQVIEIAMSNAPSLDGLPSPLPGSDELPVKPVSPRELSGPFVTVREVAQFICYSEKTIRNLKAAGAFQEGVHYFKRRGRVIFSLPATQAWVQERSEVEPIVTLPLVRSLRRGS